MGVMLLMIAIVIIGALGAFAIRHTDAIVEEKCFNPCTALQMSWAERSTKTIGITISS